MIPTPRPGSRRTLLGAVGLGLLGTVLLAGDRVASTLPLDGLLEAVGHDYWLAAALGGVAFLIAAIVAGRGDAVVLSEMPDPEEGVTVAAPGDELAATLDRPSLAVPLLATDTRASVRERLRESAVRALVHAEGHTEREARERVGSGRWTDDPDAAAFLAADRRFPPPGAYRRALAAGDPWFAHGARRTADAVAGLAEVTPEGAPAGDARSEDGTESEHTMDAEGANVGNAADGESAMDGEDAADDGWVVSG